MSTEEDKQESCSSTIKRELLRRSKNTCCLCGLYLPEEFYSKDHIKPRSLGGKNELYNYQAAHVICNGFKGNFTGVRKKPVYCEYLLNRLRGSASDIITLKTTYLYKGSLSKPTKVKLVKVAFDGVEAQKKDKRKRPEFTRYNVVVTVPSKYGL